MSAPNYTRIAALTKAPATVVAAPASLFGFCLVNPNAYAVFIKLYDGLVGNVVVGTTVPKLTLMVPASADNVWLEDSQLLLFPTGITAAATKLVADADATDLDVGAIAQFTWT